eukprot:gb/GECH01013267.1/.p1 GENE.gb/GECH01013267.1/~~gb/GECH01013267.1/.p1  ORF type:complete len:129 (+),score=17.50 gb/GECH01013267.1/:1-387(+)
MRKYLDSIKQFCSVDLKKSPKEVMGSEGMCNAIREQLNESIQSDFGPQYSINVTLSEIRSQLSNRSKSDKQVETVGRNKTRDSEETTSNETGEENSYEEWKRKINQVSSVSEKRKSLMICMLFLTFYL